MFKAARLYCQTNNQTGLKDWYFTAREGTFGPFSHKDYATKALEEFVKFNVENGNDGGRRMAERFPDISSLKLDLLPMDSDFYTSSNAKSSRTLNKIR